MYIYIYTHICVFMLTSHLFHAWGRTPPQVLGDGSDHDHLLGYGRRPRACETSVGPWSSAWKSRDPSMTGWW